MNEPWTTLLGHLSRHWMLRDYLDGDAPRVRAAMADDRWWSLSDGERAMVIAAGAILQLNECWLAVDAENRARIDAALRVALDA